MQTKYTKGRFSADVFEEKTPLRLLAPQRAGILLLALWGVGCGGPPASNTPPPNAGTPGESGAVSGNESTTTASHGTEVPIPAEQAPSPATDVAEVPASEIVRELVIDQPATLYFHSGHHYRPPFRLIQTKTKIVLNSNSGSVIIYQFPFSPGGDLRSFPELPKGVTAESSWKDLDKQKISYTLINNATSYFGRRHKTSAAAEKFSEYVKSLPFVKSVAWSDAPEGTEGGYNPAKNDDRGPRQYLRVASNAGDERDLFTSWWNPHATDDEKDEFPYVFGYPDQEYMIPNSPERAAWIKKSLDKSWRDLEHILSDGDLYIIDGKGSVRDRLREPKVQTLAQIGVILQKSVSNQQRATEIMQRLAVPRVDKTDWNPRLLVMIEYFDHSADMQDWIKSIQALNTARVPPGPPRLVTP